MLAVGNARGVAPTSSTWMAGKFCIAVFCGLDSSMEAGTKVFFATALLSLFLTICHAQSPLTNGATMKINLMTTTFTEGQPIPSRCAFDDKNVSPALQWSGVPASAKSLALICDDPDAPAGTWVHWVLYNLPPSTPGLSEGVPATPELSGGAKQGVNDFKRVGYGGPCPPPGRPHRYFFKIYALDTTLEFNPGLTKKDLLEAMNGHVIAEGELMGTYQRK
jgi:Raf kinase inhibitor-like YbhB/YbcL family protein